MILVNGGKNAFVCFCDISKEHSTETTINSLAYLGDQNHSKTSITNDRWSYWALIRTTTLYKTSLTAAAKLNYKPGFFISAIADV